MSSPQSESYLELVLDAETRRIPLKPNQVYRIGRGDQNTVRLEDGQVSRNHAVIQGTADGQFILTDVGSRNGTFLNGRRLSTSVALKKTDHIRIGEREFIFSGPASSTAPSSLSGETIVNISQKPITVLVADIRDFTGLSQSLGQEQLSTMMSSLFRRAGQVLDDHGAFGQKYIGDAIMAYWVHQAGSARLVDLYRVFAALAKLFEIVSTMQEEHGLSLPIRIGAGVNTGLAAIGNVGSTAASDHTALGDTVNLAFRLESATRHMNCDVVLGSPTHALVSATLDVKDLFAVATTELKGFDGCLEVFTGSRDSIERLTASLSRLLPSSETDQRVASCRSPATR